jgi:hypothetical protein
MIGGTLPLIIVMVSTKTLSSVKVARLPFCQAATVITILRRANAADVSAASSARDLPADQNKVANPSGTLLGHILP